MARTLFPRFILILSLLSPFALLPATGKDEFFARPLDRKLVSLRKEKFSHFIFYWHDILSGKSPSSVRVVDPPSNASITGFGLINIIDNPLTLGPELDSKMVGKAQGLYASASKEQVGLLMAMNFHFMEGKYNGSTLTVFGRNSVFDEMREMPVIGGSGLFRFARGYVQARTHKLDYNTGDATVEYNVYVMHY